MTIKNFINQIFSPKQQTKTMDGFKISVSVTITDPQGKSISLPLPDISTGQSLTNTLSAIENVAKPFFGVLGDAVKIVENL